MKLTSAQKRVLHALQHGGQLWYVADGGKDDCDGDPNAHYIVAEFLPDGDFVTWTPQMRTLLELRRRGLVEFEG